VRILLAGHLVAAVALTAAAIGAPPAAAYEASDRDQNVRAQAAPAVSKRSVRVRARRHAAPPASAAKQTSQQAPKLARPEFSEADENVAQIPGIPDARFWADSVADFERALPSPAGPWLILSTGGEEGAYGAGFLNGWSQSGARPQFAAVTGVSTGALMATYAFAGPKYDAELGQGYTTVSAGDIFEVGGTPESLTDTWPLAQLISKRVTAEMLADVAAEHRKGRRLFVATTNLDTGRTVTWNMGAIAAHGGDAALKLFRDILLASASVPGMFPPVYIKAEANGRQIEEMHVDGGVNGPLFFGPEAYLTPGSSKRLPATELYIIVNGKLTPEFSMPQRNTAAILGRSIAVALKTGARLELALAYLAAQRAGIGFHLAFVDPGFDRVGRGLFDPEYMNALFQYGIAQGRQDSRFHNGLPLAGRPLPAMSGGPSGEQAPTPK
jgi:hypothetical protein